MTCRLRFCRQRRFTLYVRARARGRYLEIPGVRVGRWFAWRGNAWTAIKYGVANAR